MAGGCPTRQCTFRGHFLHPQSPGGQHGFAVHIASLRTDTNRPQPVPCPAGGCWRKVTGRRRQGPIRCTALHLGGRPGPSSSFRNLPLLSLPPRAPPTPPAVLPAALSSGPCLSHPGEGRPKEGHPLSVFPSVHVPSPPLCLPASLPPLRWLTTPGPALGDPEPVSSAGVSRGCHTQVARTGSCRPHT